MKATINKQSCDTEKDVKLGTKAYGEFGDPAGYEITVYQMKNKRGFYVYGQGGAASNYATPHIHQVKAPFVQQFLKELE